MVLVWEQAEWCAVGVLLYVPHLHSSASLSFPCRTVYTYDALTDRILKQSGTCIPNPSHPALLAPFSNPDICPLWSERWELRTSALGCHVSTITFLTCIVSVIATLVIVGLVVGAFFFGRWVSGVWAGRGEEWWRFWRGWRIGLVDVVDRRRRTEEEEVDDEQRPLLDAE